MKKAAYHGSLDLLLSGIDIISVFWYNYFIAPV